FAPRAVECQRVCAGFRWRHLGAAHRANIDDVDDPGIADRHVEAPGLRVQENHVRSTAEGNVPEHATDAASSANNAPASQAHNRRPFAGSRSRPCGPAAGTSYSVDILRGSRASIAMIRAGDAILTKNISRAAP